MERREPTAPNPRKNCVTTMWEKDKIIPLIGVVLVISIIIPGALGLLIPAEETPSKATDMRISDVPGQSSTQRLKAVLSPQPEDDEKDLVRIVRESVFLVNSRATQCMASLVLGNETTLKSTAEIFGDEIDEILSEIDDLNITSDSCLSLSTEYQKNLREYQDLSDLLESGIPKTGNETGDICIRLIAVSNQMITIYNSIEFDADTLNNLTKESPLIAPIDTGENDTEENPGPAEAEGFSIEGAFSRGENYVYMDSKEYNRISVTVPEDTGKFTHTFSYIDEDTKHETTMTAPEGEKYYYLVISYRHAGHLDGKTETISPPKLKNHILVTSTKTYKPLSIAALGDSTSIGKSYTADKIERLQTDGSTLIYEVPEEFTPEGSYLTVNLGTTWGKQTWKLWD